MRIPPDWKIVRGILNVLLSVATFWILPSVQQVWELLPTDSWSYWLHGGSMIVAAIAIAVAGALIVRRWRGWVRSVGVGVLLAGVFDLWLLGGIILFPPF